MGSVAESRTTVSSTSMQEASCRWTTGSRSRPDSQEPGEGRGPSPRCRSASGQRRDGVGPGLDGREDGIIAVGGYPDLFAPEGDVVDLPVRIVALEGRREGVLLADVDCVPTHGGREVLIGNHSRDCAVERCNGGRTCINGTDDLGFVVLEFDTCSISLAGLGNRALGDTGNFVRGAAPGVAAQDGCNDGVESGDALNGCSEFPDCGLGDALLNKVSHSVSLPPFAGL